jgi:hypothetical protein
MKYEAYQHENGKIIVKNYFPKLGLFIDRDSPFVKNYLGVIDANNREEAILKFENNLK